VQITKTEEQEILAAVSARIPNALCPCCRSDRWNLADGYVILPVSPSAVNRVESGERLPCVALVCTNCGNTQLINLLVLGLGHLARRTPETPREAREMLRAVQQQPPRLSTV
jgi:hypothetical protein